MPHPAQGPADLGPASREPREKTRRLRQRPPHQQGGDDRHDAADGEQRAPSHERQQTDAEQTGQRRAERHAHDGHRYRDRPFPQRDELGGERGGVRHRAAQANARQQPEDAELHRTAGQHGDDGHHAEEHDVAEQGGPPAQPIADEAPDRTADHHAEVPQRHDRRERAPRHRPLPHQRGDDDAEQLVVDAIENDGQRDEEHDPLLIAGPLPAIDQPADVHGCRAGSRTGGAIRHSSPPDWSSRPPS